MNLTNTLSLKQEDDRPLCKYFANNICLRGDSCTFSHDKNVKADVVCRYYLAGICEYGKVCRYDHIRPSKNLLPSTSKDAASAARDMSGEEETQNSIQSTSSVVINAWSKPLINKDEKSDANNLNPELKNINELFSLSEISLCPYFEIGCCINGDFCTFIHGNICEMCNLFSLHPFNESLRIEHHRKCLAEHEEAMENAFAEARSAEKQCGICMENIFEKNLRFGLLEGCKHCFCLFCIRKWRRRTGHFASKIIRSCPECRVVSDYVIPSSIWIEETSEKQKIIKKYHENMKQKECKYTKMGHIDDCPFGNKCFYRHQMTDGSIVNGDSPHVIQRRRKFIESIQREVSEPNTENTIMNDVIEHIVMNLRNQADNSDDS